MSRECCHRSKAETVYGIVEGRLVIRVYAMDSAGKRTSQWSEHTLDLATAEEHVAKCVQYIAAIKALDSSRQPKHGASA